MPELPALPPALMPALPPTLVCPALPPAPALPPTPPAVQTPPVHDSPSAHTRPQLPQFAVLFIVLMQAPPHSALGAAQPHEPFVHAVPPVQAFVQEPQLVGSVARTAQLLPHFSSPTAQLLVQAPCEQTCP
jgi:hypothetical protein